MFTLESWYLGDLPALEKSFNINPSKYKNKSWLKNPDSILDPSKQLKEIIPYQKVSGSRIIGKYLELDNNNSKSFQVLIKTIREFTQ